MYAMVHVSLARLLLTHAHTHAVNQSINMDTLLNKIRNHANETELRYTRSLIAEKNGREKDRKHAKGRIAALEREIKNLRREVKDLRRHGNGQKDAQDADEWTLDTNESIDDSDTNASLEDSYRRSLHLHDDDTSESLEDLYRRILAVPDLPPSLPGSRNVSPPRFSSRELENCLKTIHPSVL